MGVRRLASSSNIRTPSSVYEEYVARGTIKQDDAQALVVKSLDILFGLLYRRRNVVSIDHDIIFEGYGKKTCEASTVHNKSSGGKKKKKKATKSRSSSRHTSNKTQHIP